MLANKPVYNLLSVTFEDDVIQLYVWIADSEDALEVSWRARNRCRDGLGRNVLDEVADTTSDQSMARARFSRRDLQRDLSKSSASPDT
jgi:hypothetical protein